MNLFRYTFIGLFALCLSNAIAESDDPFVDCYNLNSPIKDVEQNTEEFNPIVDSNAVREAQAAMDAAARARRAQLSSKSEPESAAQPKVEATQSKQSPKEIAKEPTKETAKVSQPKSERARSVRVRRSKCSSSSTSAPVDSLALLPPPAPADISPCGELSENEICDVRDGMRYDVVVIGTQTWFKRNLAYKAEGSYCPGNKNENCITYGRLYEWASANSCPEGWTLPNTEDFDNLYRYVKGHLSGFEGVGTSLKTIVGWTEDDDDGIVPGTNRFGFGAKPAGYRNPRGNYLSIGDEANFWTANEVPNEDRAIYWNLYYGNQDFIGSYEGKKSSAMSVRCIKK